MKGHKGIIFWAGWPLILCVIACGSRSTVVLVPDPQGQVGRLVVANAGGEQEIKEANQGLTVSSPNRLPGEPVVFSEEEVQALFSDTLAARPSPPLVFILYFNEDSNELTEESKLVLNQVFLAIQDRKMAKIAVSGHTDRVGEAEYNYRLALDRARVTAELLKANGAEPSRVMVTSHGEGNPLIRTEDGVAEPRNRRVEVVIR